MEGSKLSSKSQITVPRGGRQQLRIGPGDRIGFESTGDGRFGVAEAAPLRRSDGAARRRLRDHVAPTAAELAEALRKVVREHDQWIRAGR